jgi:2-octaprenyl-6-methoxyphenol hydroxylase
MQANYDLLIGGGGLVGNCLALALKDSGLKIALIEAMSHQQLPRSSAGDRALALSAGTVIMLESLGIWDRIKSQATAIKTIHISDQGHFGKTRLTAKKQGVEALGYVITARDIETPIAKMVAETAITQYCPARIDRLTVEHQSINVAIIQDSHRFDLVAKLLVGADGGNSTVRKLLNIRQQKTDYQQTALITTVTSSLANHNTAYERFTASGPLALLPIGRFQSAVIWTRNHQEAKTLLSVDETEFIDQLQACFGYRLGELTLSATRIAFPLTLVRAEKMQAPRSVIIGNAVHQLHPVAGQGFNLGLRDVAQLAKMLMQQPTRSDIGTCHFLNAYAKTRRRDHQQVIHFTHSIVKLFSNQWLGLTAIRNSGLMLLDHLPIAKKLLTDHAMGFSKYS